MSISLLQSSLYGPLFGDKALAVRLSDVRFVQRMVLFERKLALVQGQLGIIPEKAGQEIDRSLDGIVVAPETLAEGVVGAGVPVPALVTVLRGEVAFDAGQWLHWGATSQDVIDTAHVLGLAEALDVLEPRLCGLIDALETQSTAHAETLMAGRTRSQIATPITFGLRIAQWAAPLIELEQGLGDMRVKALKVQFGGASGANTAVAPHGAAITEALAAALGLQPSPPWHTNRLGLRFAADWLLHLSDALAKMAGDLILLMRSEIGEVRAGQGGGSSTMPQKQNPVTAETICVLATLARGAHAGLMASGAHAEERDGTRWPVEWMLLPQMLVMAGAALRHAQGLAETFQVDGARMRAVLDTQTGVMAEQASFALAAHMPRAEAQALVKQATATGRPLAEALAELSEADLDWPSVLDPATAIPSARETAAQIFARRRS